MAGYIARLKSLGGFQPGMQFLGLAGGLGYYARAALNAGMIATLVDLDSESIAFARMHHPLTEIFLGDVKAFVEHCDERCYDVILLRHVIEHFCDPNELLKSAETLLRPGGVMIVETDNNNGIEMLFKPGTCKWYLNLYRQHYTGVSFFSMLARRPLAVDPPRHLFAFSIANLERLLQSHGLGTLEAFTYRLGDPIYWPNLPDATLYTIGRAFARLHLRGFLTELTDWRFIPFRRLLVRLEMASGICVYASKAD